MLKALHPVAFHTKGVHDGNEEQRASDGSLWDTTGGSDGARERVVHSHSSCSVIQETHDPSNHIWGYSKALQSSDDDSMIDRVEGACAVNKNGTNLRAYPPRRNLVEQEVWQLCRGAMRAEPGLLRLDLQLHVVSSTSGQHAF